MSWRLRTLVTLFILTAWYVSAAEWYKDYAKAQDALKNGDCARAETLLLQALQQNSTTGLRVPTYGTMRMEYIPHLYLAECAYKNGKISQAANYLKEAEASGAASSSKASEFAQIKEQIRSALQAQKPSAPVTPAPSTPPPSKTVVEPPKEAPAQQPQAQPQPQQNTPPPKPAGPTPAERAAQRESTILRTLKEGNEDLAGGRFSAARDSANKVLLIDPNNAEATRLLSQIALKEAEQNKIQEKQSKLAEINRALKDGDWQTAERIAGNLKSQYPSDSAVLSISQEIEKRKAELLTQKSDEENRRTLEKEVLLSYYKGDYEKSIQLAQQALEKSSDNWRLHFFMGCSYAALALLQEENKQPRIDLAKESFRKARALAGNLTPPPYISPKILEIYRSS